MSLEVISIPEHIRAQLTADKHFVAHALNSWRACAASTHELLQQNFSCMEQTDDADEKAFLGWEIVMAAVELSELAATVLRYARDPKASPFHSADNAALKGMFQGLAEIGLPELEARQFLRLRMPPGFGKAAIRMSPVYAKLVARFQIIASSIAEFWMLHADNARWFRHLPMSFTLSEVLVVAPEGDASRGAALAEVEATPERIEALALLDEKKRVIEYRVLRMGDVVAARSTAAIASQLVINWIVNCGLDTGMWPDERRLFPFLTANLTEDEKKVLEVHGNYLLADRATRAHA